MLNKLNSDTLESAYLPDKTAPSSRGFKRFGKKLYAIIPLIAVLIIAIALFVPQGVGAIPLTADYQVGEKMVYLTTINGSFDGQTSSSSTNNANVTSTQTIEVIDFDGEYFTLNHTTILNQNGVPTLNGKPFSFSVTEKMNKTGYSSYIINLGSASQEVTNTGMTSTTYLTQLLSKPEVKVGDTVTIPYPGALAAIGMTGELKMTFRGVEDLTVPAGTYKVFRIDITSENLKINYNPTAGLSNITLPTTMNIDVSYQMFMEYGTMRQIKSTMVQSVSYESENSDYAMHLNLEMILNQHTKP